MEFFNLVCDHILIDNSSRKRNRDNDNNSNSKGAIASIMKLSNKVVVCKVIR